MSKRKKRDLRPDEKALWERVKRTSNPMHERLGANPLLPEIAEPSKAKKPTPAPSFTIEPFRIGETSTAPPVLGKSIASAPSIDRKTLNMMRRGKMKPEARIDLHGMTQDRAIGVLSTFIQDASARQLRLVLVITGKGRPRPDFGPIPERPGVLRRNVPQWLRTGMMGPLVQDVVQSHQSHGGEGAFYVYLRRRR